MRISDWSSDVCSSDLGRAGAQRSEQKIVRGRPRVRAARHHRFIRCQPRSEEHTSELQSLMRISYAVFCLKKKKKIINTKNKNTIYKLNTYKYINYTDSTQPVSLQIHTNKFSNY